MTSANSEYFLVTLDQLDYVSQTINPNDLLYVLQYDPRSSKYNNEANKMTFSSLNAYIKATNGTSITYNAGTNPGEVLLIPTNGTIPNTLLPLANGSAKGISGKGTSDNIIFTNGIINLNNVLDISGIQTANNFNINCNSLLINGEVWKGNYSSNNILTVENNLISLNLANGFSAYYILSPLVGNDIINFDTSNIELSPNKVYNFKIILIGSNIARNITWNTNPSWITSIEANKKYIISIDVLPKEVLGDLTMVPSIISVI